MRFYRLYITENAIDRAGDGNKVIWQRTVKATSRIGALHKCLPQIRKQVLTLIEDDTIRFVSVYCGRRGHTNAANRMQPIQLTRDGAIRA